MRRIVLIVLLVVVAGVAGYMLLRPRRAAPRSRPAGSDTSAAAAAQPAGRSRGRTTGRLKTKTKAELKVEKQLRRAEEKRRKRELRRQERERQRRLRSAGRRSVRSKRGRKGSPLYAVSAIVSLGSESYALIDGRRVGVGDVVMGRRIAAIFPDRLEVEAFGRTMTVRVGESLLPSYYADRRKRRG